MHSKVTGRRFGAVVLAAGASVRMGEPKQLLRIGSRAMVARAIDAVLGAGADAVVVVLGSGAERVRACVEEAFREELQNGRLATVLNHEWPQGMGSSVRAGVDFLQATHTDLEGVLIALCDQPAFDGHAARALVAAWSERAASKTIVAASYGGGVGAPALFSREHFAELTSLSGDRGARSILTKHSDAILAVSLPALSEDLDTPQDFEPWKAAHGGDR